MKRIIFLIVGLFLSMQLLPQANIKFKQTAIDMGQMKPGQPLNVQFEFENVGKNLLIIKDIRTSCACTVARFEKKEYKPGEKGVIPIRFDTRGRMGKHTQYATLSTNDPNNPYVQLKLTVILVRTDFPKITISPNRLDFEEVVMTQTYEQTVTIMNEGTVALRILELTHTPEISTDFSDKVIQPGKEAKLKITFKPLQGGRYISFLKIRSNDRKGLAIIRVEASVSEAEEESSRR
jgi:hypothetical protein